MTHPYDQIQILYEDEILICLNKPSHLSTTQTLDRQRPSLEGFVKDYLQSQQIHFPHRLDVGTSGVVLVSKNPRYHKQVSELFEKRYALKIYWALCRCLPDFWEKKSSSKGNLPLIDWSTIPYLQEIAQREKSKYESWITQISKESIWEKWDQERMIIDPSMKHLPFRKMDHLKLLSKKPDFYGSVHSGGLKAITDFRLLHSYPQYQLIEASPKTGRTHQIRVHLSESQAPIIGDQLYAKTPITTQNLMLKAIMLIFPHPLEDRILCIQALPHEFSIPLNKNQNGSDQT